MHALDCCIVIGDVDGSRRCSWGALLPHSVHCRRYRLVRSMLRRKSKLHLLRGQLGRLQRLLGALQEGWEESSAAM